MVVVPETRNSSTVGIPNRTQPFLFLSNSNKPEVMDELEKVLAIFGSVSQGCFIIGSMPRHRNEGGINVFQLDLLLL